MKRNILSRVSRNSRFAVIRGRFALITACAIGPGLVIVAVLMSAERKSLAAPPPADAGHAAHIAAGTMPTDGAKSDRALAAQISQLQAKVAKLEAALASRARRQPIANAPAAGTTPGMTAPAAGNMNMAAKMDKMMGMMEKMMSMQGGAMPARALMASGAAGQGMGMMEGDMDEMGAMQPGQATSAAGGMAGMNSGATPSGIEPSMAARLDKMLGMMDLMVRMMDRMTGGAGSGAAASNAAMSGGAMMDDDQMEMGSMGGGAMKPGQPAPPMSDM